MVKAMPRHSTSPDTVRALPDFLVIGAMRAGTTLVHELLSNLPAVSLPGMKETDHFIPELHGSADAATYGRHFDLRAATCGEVNPNYTKRDVFPGVPERIHAANPDVRLIYIVRDPVKRCVSQYQHSVMYGQKMPPPGDLLQSEKGAHILNTSRYAWQLEPWLAVFAAEQLLVVDFDELTRDPAVTFERICAHIGIAAPVDVLATKRNSSAEVGAVPGWWLALRDTRAWRAIRPYLPYAMMTRAKRLLAGVTPEKSVPDFPESVLAEIANELAADAAVLRRLTGLRLESWKV